MRLTEQSWQKKTMKMSILKITRHANGHSYTLNGNVFCFFEIKKYEQQLKINYKLIQTILSFSLYLSQDINYKSVHHFRSVHECMHGS